MDGTCRFQTRTTHLSENTKGGIESDRRSVTEFSSKMRVFPGNKLSHFLGMKGINTHQVTLICLYQNFKSATGKMFFVLYVADYELSCLHIIDLG